MKTGECLAAPCAFRVGTPHWAPSALGCAWRGCGPAGCSAPASTEGSSLGSSACGRSSLSPAAGEGGGRARCCWQDGAGMAVEGKRLGRAAPWGRAGGRAALRGGRKRVRGNALVGTPRKRAIPFPGVCAEGTRPFPPPEPPHRGLDRSPREKGGSGRVAGSPCPAGEAGRAGLRFPL